MRFHICIISCGPSTGRKNPLGPYKPASHLKGKSWVGIFVALDSDHPGIRKYYLFKGKGLGVSTANAMRIENCAEISIRNVQCTFSTITSSMTCGHWRAFDWWRAKMNWLPVLSIVSRTGLTYPFFDPLPDMFLIGWFKLLLAPSWDVWNVAGQLIYPNF
jgi:hypothetical protein